MKSIVKILIVLLAVINLTLSKTLHKKASANTSLKSLLQAYSMVKTKWNGSGSFKLGLGCPGILLGQNGQQLSNQGAALMQGAKLFDVKDEFNNRGLVLDFYKPLAQNSVFSKVSINISSNKYYIPWRYFYGVFTYENPTLSFKNIKGILINDAGDEFKLQINLPYKYFGYYINDEDAIKIKDRINSQGRHFISELRAAKDEINNIYPKYDAQKENEIQILQGAAKINVRIGLLKKQITFKQKENEKRLASEKNLKRDLNAMKEQLNILEKKLNAKKSQIVEGNSEISSLATSIEDLNKSKTNPQDKIQKATRMHNQVEQDARKLFGTLITYAISRQNDVKAAHSFWLKYNEKEFNKNLDKIFPN